MQAFRNKFRRWLSTSSRSQPISRCRKRAAMPLLNRLAAAAYGLAELHSETALRQELMDESHSSCSNVGPFAC